MKPLVVLALAVAASAASPATARDDRREQCSSWISMVGTTTETCRTPGRRERVCTSYRHAGGSVTTECR